MDALRYRSEASCVRFSRSRSRAWRYRSWAVQTEASREVSVAEIVWADVDGAGSGAPNEAGWSATLSPAEAVLLRGRERTGPTGVRAVGSNGVVLKEEEVLMGCSVAQDAIVGRGFKECGRRFESFVFHAGYVGVGLCGNGGKESD